MANTGFKNETPEKAKITNISKSEDWKGKKAKFSTNPKKPAQDQHVTTTVPFGIV